VYVVKNTLQQTAFLAILPTGYFHIFSHIFVGTQSLSRSRAMSKFDYPSFNFPTARFPQLRYPLDTYAQENREEEQQCLDHVSLRPVPLISLSLRVFWHLFLKMLSRKLWLWCMIRETINHCLLIQCNLFFFYSSRNWF